MKRNKSDYRRADIVWYNSTGCELNRWTIDLDSPDEIRNVLEDCIRIIGIGDRFEIVETEDDDENEKEDDKDE